MSCNLAAPKTSSLRAARQTSSAKVSAARPSPSAMPHQCGRAPRRRAAAACCSICSARASSFSIAAGIERFEHQHARARQQRRVQLERRVLGGGADQNDGAVFHHRQETVLLGAVEAMDLVDEQQRALPQFAAAARFLEHFLQVGDAGEDRGNLLEMQVGRLRQQPRHRGLAGAGRAPEHQAAERARRQHAGQRAVGAEQMVLADHLVELLRAQPVGERARRILVEAGGGEQSRARFGARGHPLKTAVICCPPRRMMMRQEAFGLRGDAREIVRRSICSPLTDDDDVAALEAEIAGIGAVVDVEDDDAVVGALELQFVGQRRRQIGDLGAGKRRARADGDLVARRRRRRCAAPPARSVRAAVAQRAERRRAAERLGGEAVIEGVEVVDLLPVDRNDHVAGFEPGMRGRAVRR